MISRGRNAAAKISNAKIVHFSQNANLDVRLYPLVYYVAGTANDTPPFNKRREGNVNVKKYFSMYGCLIRCYIYSVNNAFGSCAAELMRTTSMPLTVLGGLGR